MHLRLENTCSLYPPSVSHLNLTGDFNWLEQTVTGVMSQSLTLNPRAQVIESIGPTAGGLINMTFAINNNPDNSLGSGWQVLPHVIADEKQTSAKLVPPNTLGTCPFIRQPKGDRYYYVGTIGNLLRSPDLVHWTVSPSNPVFRPNTTTDVRLSRLNPSFERVATTHAEISNFIANPWAWDFCASVSIY